MTDAKRSRTTAFRWLSNKKNFTKRNPLRDIFGPLKFVTTKQFVSFV